MITNNILLACLILYQIYSSGVQAQKIVIVGGGVSGLSAANYLCRSDICDITILEAEGRVGGRLYTDTFEGEIVERGAQWMHGIDGNPVYSLISQNYPVIVDDHDEEGSIHRSSGKAVNGEMINLLYDAEGLYDELNEKLMALNKPSTEKNTVLVNAARKLWDDMLNTKPVNLKKAVTDAIFHYTMTQWSMEDGERAQNVSVLAYLYYHYLEGGDVIVPQGYSVLLGLLQRDISKSCVNLNTEVTKIIWDGPDVTSPGKVNVKYTSNDGTEGQINADHVIVTVSLGVLQKHHRTMLVPSFSKQQAQALDTMRLGIVNKIFMHFEKKFWNDGDFPYRFLWDSDIKKEFREDAHWFTEISQVEIYRENILLVWANNYISTAVLHLPDQEIGRRITMLLRKFMANDMIPFPDNMYVTRWHENEHFLGSYSYIALGETTATQEIARRPLKVNGVPKVLFAGEATDIGRYSTVDGAYRSGIREASRIVKTHS